MAATEHSDCSLEWYVPSSGRRRRRFSQVESVLIFKHPLPSLLCQEVRIVKLLHVGIHQLFLDNVAMLLKTSQSERGCNICVAARFHVTLDPEGGVVGLWIIQTSG